MSRARYQSGGEGEQDVKSSHYHRKSEKNILQRQGRGTNRERGGGERERERERGFQRRRGLCGCHGPSAEAIWVLRATTCRQRAERQADHYYEGRREGLDFGGCRLRIFKFSFSYLRLQNGVVLMLF